MSDACSKWTITVHGDWFILHFFPSEFSGWTTVLAFITTSISTCFFSTRALFYCLPEHVRRPLPLISSKFARKFDYICHHALQMTGKFSAHSLSTLCLFIVSVMFFFRFSAISLLAVVDIQSVSLVSGWCILICCRKTKQHLVCEDDAHVYDDHDDDANVDDAHPIMMTHRNVFQKEEANEGGSSARRRQDGVLSRLRTTFSRFSGRWPDTGCFPSGRG